MAKTAVMVVSPEEKGVFGSWRLAGSRVSLNGVGSTFHKLPLNCFGISELRLHSDNSNWPVDGKKSGAEISAYAGCDLSLPAVNSGKLISAHPSPVKST